MDYDQFLELVKARRSIRSFKPDPIPVDHIEKILEAARWAPSGANSQPWEFIVITDTELKNKIVNLMTPDRLRRVRKDDESRSRPQRRMMLGFKDAPVFIIVCGDIRRKIFYSPYEMVNGKIVIKEGPISRAEGIFNSSLAHTFLYIQLAVRTLGLVSQWVSATSHQRNQSEIKRLLKIPEYLVIYDTIALGYSDSEPRPRDVRTLGEITHYNQYDKSKSKTDNEIINLSRRPIMSNMVGKRIFKIVEQFRKKGATNPENAMTVKELDLPPFFRQMMQRRQRRLNIFVEVNGKYYLSEEGVKELQKQLKDR